MIFSYIEACDEAAILRVIYFIKIILGVVFVILPIILSLILVIDLVKTFISNPGEIFNKLKISFSRLFSYVCLILVPVFVNILMVVLENVGIDWSYCYNNAESSRIKDLDIKNESVFSIDAVYPSYVIDLSSNKGSATVKANPSSGEYCDDELGCGLGKASKISIDYSVNDSEGRCGQSTCASIAKVEYPSKTVTYYMGYQGQVGVDANTSCRINAFTAAANAVNDSHFSAADLYSYLGSKGYTNGARSLTKSSMDDALTKFGVKEKAKVYYSASDAKKMIQTGLDHGQPVMAFVAHSKCSDLAVSTHALLLLGYDRDDNVVFIDSGNKAIQSSYKKRNVEELSKCLVNDGTNYYKLIFFSFDQPTTSNRSNSISKNSKFKVLFVGNSYTNRAGGTSGNGIDAIPKALVSIADQQGYQMDYRFAYKSGAKLNAIYEENVSLIHQKYDYVILQPFSIASDTSEQNYIGASKVIKATLEKNKNVKFYFRRVWGTKSTNKERLDSNYAKFASIVSRLERENNIDITMIDDGKCMYDALWNYNINVFHTDDYHQSDKAVYLIDYCIYAKFFGQDPTKLPHKQFSSYSSISNDLHKQFTEIAKKYCY